MSRVAELRERREALVARSAGLRRQMVDHGTALEESLSGVDRGIRALRSVRAKPLALAAGGALLLALGPGRALGWVSRGLFFLSLARRAYGLVSSRVQSARTNRRYEDSQLFI